VDSKAHGLAVQGLAAIKAWSLQESHKE